MDARTRSRVLTAAVFAALTVTALPCMAADILPAERRTAWNPGLNPVGGIPSRSTVFRTVQASTYGNGAQDAAPGIQAAIDACPAGQIVQLSAGTFKISSGAVRVNKGITLRGAGPGQTVLKAPDGGNIPVIIVGTRWPGFAGSTNLTANAVKGANSVTVASTTGLAAGQLVLLDQLTNPDLTQWSPNSPPGDPSRGWFSRTDRSVAQVMEIASVSGNTVTFTTPFHITFDLAHTAQLARFGAAAVKNAGVEDLTAYGGEIGDSGGNFYVELAAYSWLKNVESHMSRGAGVHMYRCFRCVLRDSYIHESKNPNPGGDGYGIDVSMASADNLIENNISWLFNKVMVMRASGGGNVIGYNYVEDGIIGYQHNWVESGLNATHMTTPHYELFEGNQGFNFDGESTWGNSIYITVFRNHLTTVRRDVAKLGLTDEGWRRAVSLNWGHYWYSFIGNVLGYQGMAPGPFFKAFAYEDFYPWGDEPLGLWKVGVGKDWGPADPKVAATLIRHGNFDYVTNSQKWDPNIAEHGLPDSLYLTAKPAFFGSRTWPWVQPGGATRLFTLPARERFDAMRAPTIVNQPSPVTVAAGQTATFSVAATGAAPLSYQWKKNGANIPGATAASYTTPATALADSGAKFSCTVSNSLGSATSAEAVLTVTAANRPPQISAFSPASPVTVPAGTTQAFGVDAWDPDGDALGYAWKLDGATQATTIDTMNYSPVALDAGAHTILCTVSDGWGGSVGQSWNVTVTTNTPAIALSTTSLAPSATAGSNAAAQSFQVWNSGMGTLNYTVSPGTTAWLAANPASGDSTGPSDKGTIAVTYSTSGLAAGSYSATITVSAAGLGSRTVAVTLAVSASGGGGDSGGGDDDDDDGGGGGGGCALAPPSGSAGALGGSVPYLALGAFWIWARLRARARR